MTDIKIKELKKQIVECNKDIKRYVYYSNNLRNLIQEEKYYIEVFLDKDNFWEVKKRAERIIYYQNQIEKYQAEIKEATEIRNLCRSVLPNTEKTTIINFK